MRPNVRHERRPKGAKLPWGRPLDGGVRRHCSTQLEPLCPDVPTIAKRSKIEAPPMRSLGLDADFPGGNAMEFSNACGSGLNHQLRSPSLANLK